MLAQGQPGGRGLFLMWRKTGGPGEKPQQACLEQTKPNRHELPGESVVYCIRPETINRQAAHDKGEDRQRNPSRPGLGIGGAQPSPSSSNTTSTDYVVRVPNDGKKKYNMIKFSSGTDVDFLKMTQTTVEMERENNYKDYKATYNMDAMPKFGAGSEYGRDQKEEARRKKFGINRKKYNPEAQPWSMKVGSGKNAKKFKGVREGTITSNTSYYIFTKCADGAFEAHPIEEWYNFQPLIRYKYLNSDEAEEEFNSSSEDEKVKQEKYDDQGVEQEAALRKLIDSGDSSEGEQEENKEEENEEEEEDKGPKKKKEGEESESSSSSSDSDSDIEKEEKISSVLFMQKKKGGSRSNTPTLMDTKDKTVTDGKSEEKEVKKEAIKRPMEPEESDAKKMRTDSPVTNSAISSGEITEETIRRYLMRKPMTAKEWCRNLSLKNHR